MKKIKIDMFQEYVSKLIFRCCVFLVVLLAYLFEPDYFDLILTKKVEMQWLLSGLSSEQIRQMLGNPDGEYDIADVPAEQTHHDGQQKRFCEPLSAGGALQRAGTGGRAAGAERSARGLHHWGPAQRRYL